jgi:hypothetical protein
MGGKEIRIIPLVFYDQNGKRFVIGEGRVDGSVIKWTVHGDLNSALADYVIASTSLQRLAFPDTVISDKELLERLPEMEIKMIADGIDMEKEQRLINNIFGIHND